MKNYLILGLGNPGDKYNKTRHNIGFEIVNEIKKELQEKLSQPEVDFSFEKKMKSEVAIFKNGNKKIILAKPQTFMNLSGEAAKEIADFHKVETENILVIHDDLDLPLGKIRFSKDSGPAGHNGVKSIIQELGTQDFSRLRFGVSPDDSENEEKIRNQIPTEKFVLQKFGENEMETVEAQTKKASQATLFFLENDFEKSAGEFN